MNGEPQLKIIDDILAAALTWIDIEFKSSSIEQSGTSFNSTTTIATYYRLYSGSHTYTPPIRHTRSRVRMTFI